MMVSLGSSLTFFEMLIDLQAETAEQRLQITAQAQHEEHFPFGT